MIPNYDNWLTQPDQDEMDRRVAESFGVDPGVEDAVEEDMDEQENGTVTAAGLGSKKSNRNPKAGEDS